MPEKTFSLQEWETKIEVKDGENLKNQGLSRLVKQRPTMRFISCHQSC